MASDESDTYEDEEEGKTGADNKSKTKLKLEKQPNHGSNGNILRGRSYNSQLATMMKIKRTWRA